jgi:hypothetical protein
MTVVLSVVLLVLVVSSVVVALALLNGPKDDDGEWVPFEELQEERRMNDEGRHGRPLSAAAWQVAAEEVQEREREFRAKLAKALDVPDGGQYLNDFLIRIQALQERAEKAERERDSIQNRYDSLAQHEKALHDRIDVLEAALSALSPTQETDQ